MKLKMLTLGAALGFVLVAVVLGSASSGEAAAKRGLMPGKWHGMGVISGSITDEAATTTFSGKLGFRLNVAKNLAVGGSGSWVKTMKGRGLVSSTMTGIARLVFTGTGSGIKFGYTETVDGTITANGMTKPVSFDLAPAGFVRLVITRARTCTAAGTIPTGDGAKITWTAKRLGRCTE